MPKFTSDRSAVTYLIREMKKRGIEAFSVNNNEELISLVGKSEADILAELFQTDDEVVTFRRGSEEGLLGVHFVYGNEPFEVASNWGPVESPLADVFEALVYTMDE